MEKFCTEMLHLFDGSNFLFLKKKKCLANLCHAKYILKTKSIFSSYFNVDYWYPKHNLSNDQK